MPLLYRYCSLGRGNHQKPGEFFELQFRQYLGTQDEWLIASQSESYMMTKFQTIYEPKGWEDSALCLVVKTFDASKEILALVREYANKIKLDKNRKTKSISDFLNGVYDQKSLERARKQLYKILNVSYDMQRTRETCCLYYAVLAHTTGNPFMAFTSLAYFRHAHDYKLHDVLVKEMDLKLHKIFNTLSCN
jgi:hypothetical protein